MKIVYCNVYPTGSLIITSVPSPRTLSIEIVPPWSFIISYAMESPRPVPPFFTRARLIDTVETLENLGKVLFRIPIPLSFILI